MSSKTICDAIDKETAKKLLNGKIQGTNPDRYDLSKNPQCIGTCINAEYTGNDVKYAWCGTSGKGLASGKAWAYCDAKCKGNNGGENFKYLNDGSGKPAPQSQGLTCSNGTLNTDDFDIKKYNGGQFSKSEKTGNGWDTQNQSLCRKNMCIKWLGDTSDGKNRIYSCTVPEGQQPSNVSESCCSEYAKKIGYKYQTRSWNDIPTGCVKSVNPGAKDVWFNTNANPSCIGKGEGCEGKTTTKGTFTVVSDEMTDCKKKHKGHRGNKGSDNINIVIANSGGGSPDQPPHEYIDPLNYTSNPPGPLNQNPDGGSGNDNTDDQSGDSGQTPPSQTPPSQTPSGSTSSSVVVNPPPKSSNTLLYVGIGVVVLLLLLFLLYRFYKKRGLSGQPIAPPITQPIRPM